MNSKATLLFLVGALCALAANAAFRAKPVHPSLQSFRAPAVRPVEHVRGLLWIEAESFADYGDWRLDTQFTHKMGSAYLIAPGIGQPIGDARTKVAFPRAGRWHVWARTKDWLPEHSPGRFRISVGGEAGDTLGASRRVGWGWEKAGAFVLAAGETEVRLVDLSGAFARCDALVFAEDAAYVPPSDEVATAAERLRLTGESASIADKGTFDVVVVGAGVGGLGAAFAAARTGARTALVHDRPVLGGNSSVELGIGTDGAAISHPDARETGLCEEANLRSYELPERSLSAAYRDMAGRETNLVVFANQRVFSVEKDGNEISSVCARDTLTGVRSRYRARLFIDATGDGWVGVFADAARMYGREGREEYGEAPAPERRDELTMSGCLMDRSLCYSYAMRDKPVPYVAPAWADVLPQGFTRRIRHIGPEWWIEHGGRFDDLADPERARDELVRIAFAYWGWVKNASPLRDKARNAEITHVPFMNGRREGYRLEGDYVLTANDCLAGRVFPDRVSYGGWPLDTHDPLGIDNPNGNGYWKHHPPVPIYTIPFRCLYSKNVPNLLFAGRCVSVTHIALGSVRVEATLFALGQAAGTAAAMALSHGLLPREYGRDYIGELQQRLLKDDLYIPALRNEDSLDFARSARVTATSGAEGALLAADNADPHLLHRRDAHELTHERAVRFDCAAQRIDAVECRLKSDNGAPTPLTARLVEVDDAVATPERGRLVALLDGIVPPKEESFVRFVPRTAVNVTGRTTHLWLVLPKAKGVSWRLRARALSGGARAWLGGKVWNLVDGVQYAFLTAPYHRQALDSSAAAVVDGVSRPVGSVVHGWVSDPSAALPQSLRLDFQKPVRAQEVRLTFDSDLMPTRAPRHSPRLVKAYAVDGLVDGVWRRLVTEDGNFQRHRVHTFVPANLAALRVTVMQTWGDRSARLFEVRVY